MELRVTIAGTWYGADLSRPESLAIPMRFGGPQPRFFGASAATAAPLKGTDFVGDVGRGGSCNVSEIHLVPHCNGTHTENVGHIVRTIVPVFESVTQSLMPALVVSVAPESDPATGESAISKAALSQALADSISEDVLALIVRTLPNGPAKKALDYDEGDGPPCFTEDAMGCIIDRAFRHLLVDFPSIDPMHDQGKLANHRLFWNVAPGSTEAGPDTRTDKTVTEMIYVEPSVPDGLCLLDLQVPAWHSDAAPSNPVIYPLTSEA